MCEVMESRDRSPVIVISANSVWNIANFRSGLIRALKSHGYEIIIAAPPSDEGACCPPELGTHMTLPVRSDGLNPVQDAALLWHYLRLFRKVRPTAYLSFTAKPNIYGALAAGMLAIPAFPNVSGLGTAFIRGGLLQHLISLLYRTGFRKAPAVFFQNGEDRDLFIERKLVRSGQARLLSGSGVDLDRFRPPASRGQRTGCTFLFVGRLLGDKGVRELIGAARILREKHPGARVQLLGFLGSANRTSIASEEVAGWEREGLIEYLGCSEDVRPFLLAADAAVLPSYREGLPRSLLEAAAMGLPLIATDVPGNREVVHPGKNGMLCQVRSAESLAEALIRFIELPAAEREHMGRESRRMVEERFSEEKVVRAYLDAIAEFGGDSPKAEGVDG